MVLGPKSMRNVTDYPEGAWFSTGGGSGGEGADDGRRAGAAEVAGQPGAGRDEGAEVDAVLDAETGEQPDQVLGRQVAGRALRVGTAAEATGARVVRRDAGAQAGHRVRQRLSVRVVEVQGEVVDGHAGLGERAHQRRHVAGRADPDRVAQAELARAEVEEP